MLEAQKHFAGHAAVAKGAMAAHIAIGLSPAAAAASSLPSAQPRGESMSAQKKACPAASTTSAHAPSPPSPQAITSTKGACSPAKPLGSASARAASAPAAHTTSSLHTHTGGGGSAQVSQVRKLGGRAPVAPTRSSHPSTLW